MNRKWTLLFALFLSAAGSLAAAQSGVLQGRVLVAGSQVPAATLVENSTDPEECGRVHSLEDFVSMPGGRGLGNVILAVTGVPASSVPVVESERLVIDNRDCRFSPHVAVLTVGATVEALNSDVVLHTTHLYGPTESNISLPFQGSRSSRRVDEPGMIIVKCDVHGWMQAFVRVDTHPYHAVSRADGRFRIEDLPPGQFVLETWHERLGVRRLSVRIVAGRTLDVVIEYPTP